jgi:hypothetical protein
MQKRKVWKHKMCNPDLVPDEMWEISDAKLKAEMRRQLDMNKDETPVLPGVTFYQEEILVAVGFK